MIQFHFQRIFDVKTVFDVNFFLTSKISKLKKSGLFNGFDFIFIDTPPTMSSLVQEGIAASDYYIIPTKPEFLAIEGVAQAMDFAKKTLKNLGRQAPL
mgnify:CR=1 FL=1